MSGKTIPFGPEPCVDVCVSFLSAILLGQLGASAGRPYPLLHLADQTAIQSSMTLTIIYVSGTCREIIQQHKYHLLLGF